MQKMPKLSPVRPPSSWPFISSGRLIFSVFFAFVFALCTYSPFLIWAERSELLVSRIDTELAKVPEKTVSRHVVHKYEAQPVTGGTFQTEFGVFMTSGTAPTKCKLPEVSPPPADLRKEALSAFNVALTMETLGKLEKASRLFQHAVALDPSNSEILTEYGTFLETHHADIVQADTLYLKAVYADPGNHRALTLRVRTQPLVEEIDQKAFDRIDQMMLEFYSKSHEAMMLKKQKRAFMWQLHHSVAIEGNTFTFEETKSVIEKRLAIAGKSIMEHNEILGMDAALNFLNDTLVSRIGPVSLTDVLDMHLRILGFNDPVHAGKFRKTQVYISDHVPPDASEVPQLMTELIEWMNSEDASQMHPIKLATLAHYFLVHIHPFVDGNGRVGRLLMNLILMRSGFPPVVIRVTERKLYYQCLKDANAGDIRPFVRFISQCMEMTLSEYLFSTSEAEMFTRSRFPVLPSEEHSDTILLPAVSFSDKNHGGADVIISA